MSGIFLFSQTCPALQIAFSSEKTPKKAFDDDLFPDESETIIRNMRCAIANSYASLGDYEQSESEFEKLVQDYPANPWGYTGWGDMYFLDKKDDYDKAKELYMKALAIAEDKDDIMAVNERLEGLEDAIRSEQPEMLF